MQLRKCVNFVDRQGSLQALGGKPVTLEQWIELIQVRRTVAGNKYKDDSILTTVHIHLYILTF